MPMLTNHTQHRVAYRSRRAYPEVTIMTCYDYRRLFSTQGIAWLLAALVATLAAFVQPAFAAANRSFFAFESGQVRPLAMSPDGKRLFATNTPDGRLEVFRITPKGLVQQYSVPVGLEPVAVAARSNDEVWVVNHLSDSVSIVRLFEEDPPQVIQTLQVGDEPRDIVFAGPNRNRAFITTAHRGQNSPLSFEPFKPVGRADIWVFDAADFDDPLTIVTLFGDTPRALATSPDGKYVYAGIFHSGNRTTVLSSGVVGGDNPPPRENVEGVAAPETGLIVRKVGDRWLDAGGNDWSPVVRMNLPDYDVFKIDTMANPPVEVERFSGVGTTLFNIAVNPVSGTLYVSNIEARNHVRFEGPGILSEGETVRGHFVENRITVIDEAVRPRHLNKHIDYKTFPGTEWENERSLATPLEMVVSADGTTLYLAAFGSRKVARFNAAKLEDNTFQPTPAQHIELSAGGPSGLVLDEANERLYVLTRFNNAIAIIDLTTHAEINSIPLYDSEPDSLTVGRRFLYDARLTSSRGDSSCAGCHIFGDMDHLSWDLGNPDGLVEPNPNPPAPTNPVMFPFHPMKGPLMTQSLRGLADHGPMHWRGDRTGGNDPDSGDPLDERAAFRAFNVAFEGLLGRTEPLTEAQMEAFTDFALQLFYPPNPYRALDNSLTDEQAQARRIYFNQTGDLGVTCNGCHRLDPEQGFFGSSGLTSSGRSEGQSMKVPQLRNLYTKVGFFGRAVPPDDPLPFAGDQIRGFGYLSDGSMDTLPNFLLPFDNNFSDGIAGDQERLAMSSFLLAYENSLAPIVGQQVTLSEANLPTGSKRLQLLHERALAGECDLVGKGVVSGKQRGLLLTSANEFQTDRREQVLSFEQALDLIRLQGARLTYTCVPPGSGMRIGLDRDEDGILDGDEET